MKELLFDIDKHQLPTSWNELSQEQILKMQFWINAGTGEFKAREKILAILLQAQKDTHIVIDLADLKAVTKPFFGSCDLTKTPIRKIRGKGLSYLYGPEDGYENMTFGEWMSLDQKLEKIFASKGKKSMNDLAKLANEFCAMLFRKRKKGKTGDIREDFNSDTTSERIKYVDPLTDHAKLAMMAQFNGVKNQMGRAFPKVFKSRKPKSNKIKDRIRKKKGPNWMQVVHSYSKGDATKYQMIFDMNVWIFFHSLNENNADAEKAIAEMDKLRRK